MSGSVPTQPGSWVLLRGLMREQRHWGAFPAQFQTEFAAPVVCLDFAGNGSLHAQRSASNVAAMWQDLRTQLQQLGHSPPYRVLALSLGAMVAVDWARQFPEEIEKLVLINTSLAPYNPFYHRLRPQNYPALLRFLCTASLAQREALILRLTSQQSASAGAPAILQQWVSYATLCPSTRRNILRQLYAAIRYRAAPDAPTVPLLLLAGRQDRLVNVECSIALAQRWRCPLKIHPHASHDIPLDDAAWVIQQIRLWLSQVEV